MGRPRIWANDAERMAAARSGGRAISERADAIEVGRRMGAETAAQLRESGDQTQQRIARAKAYAAWEFDGKPDSWAGYVKEFGVRELAPVLPSLERPLA